MPKLTVKNRYGQAPVEMLNDISISFRAKGLWVFFQSKPDNWNFSVERIAKQSKEGKEAIQSAIKELEDAGYLSRTASKTGDGKWDGYDYELIETPSAGNPSAGNPSTVKPVTLSKIEFSKIEDSKIEPLLPKQIAEIIDCFKPINPTIKFGQKTYRKSAESIISRMGFEKAKAIAEYAVSIQGKQYTPTITNPYQLELKMPELTVYARKQTSNAPVVC